MTEKNMDSKDLDGFFEAARSAAPRPPETLMARVLEDAIAAQPVPVTSRPVAGGVGPWREFLRSIGGWPAMGGLVTATVAGIWLGVSPPDILPDATMAYMGLGDAGYVIDTATGFGFDLSEEAL